MPTYEFQCDACGERFEVVASLAQRDELAVCPACGSRDVHQVFTSFTVGIARAPLNPGYWVRRRGSKYPEYVEPKG